MDWINKMKTRYNEENCIYIQFFKSDNVTRCMASEGYNVYYPDRRKSLENNSLAIGEIAHKHIESMKRLGKDFSNVKFELLTRYEWSNLK
jgi:hypothetical protein